jgi:hypothetical protein
LTRHGETLLHHLGAAPPRAAWPRLLAAADAHRPQVIIAVLVGGLALPLCIWDLARHKHETAYVGASRALGRLGADRAPALTAHPR